MLAPDRHRTPTGQTGAPRQCKTAVQMSGSELGERRREQLARARLYLVCDTTPAAGPLPEFLRAAIAGGVDIIQLREKRLAEEELTAIAREVARLCAELGALLIVNDRPAIALAAGADGVHVGQQDMPVAQARELVGTELLLGLSTHSPREIDRAVPSDDAGYPLVDYIGVGPVHATPTKPGRPAVGYELVRYAAGGAQVPFFAIGGLDETNVQEVLDAGAQRVCVLRAIACAPDPQHSARALRRALESPSQEPREPAREAVEDRSPKLSRGQLRDELARAELTPLGEDERPLALRIAIAVALVLALGVLVGATSIRDLSRHGGSVPGAIFLALVLISLALGMYRRRYWAVLGFQALLAFQVLVTSLALVVASTIQAAVLCLASIGLGGLLFWKLVRVMGRIQAGAAGSEQSLR